MLSHGALMAGRAEWMPGITAGVAMIIAVALAIASTDVRVRIVWLAAALVARRRVAHGAGSAALRAAGRDQRRVRDALRGDARALVASRGSRRSRASSAAELPPELAHYTRRLTWVWTVLFFALRGVGLLLAVVRPAGRSGRRS